MEMCLKRAHTSHTRLTHIGAIRKSTIWMLYGPIARCSCGLHRDEYFFLSFMVHLLFVCQFQYFEYVNPNLDASFRNLKIKFNLNCSPLHSEWTAFDRYIEEKDDEKEKKRLHSIRSVATEIGLWHLRWALIEYWMPQLNFYTPYRCKFKCVQKPTQRPNLNQ